MSTVVVVLASCLVEPVAAPRGAQSNVSRVRVCRNLHLPCASCGVHLWGWALMRHAIYL